MLKGPALGAAIEAARKKKNVTKAAIAAHFGIKSPSVQDWVKNGTVAKDKLPSLWAYFSDVVGPEHWGLTAYPQVAGELTPTLEQALSIVLRSFSDLSGGRWAMVRARLDQLIGAPEMLDDVVLDVLPMLQAPARKRTGTGG
jgi:hypothetical protein